MNPPTPAEPSGRFLRPITNRTVAQALPPALLWAYVAAVAVGIVVAAVALLALAVAAIAWIFDRDQVIGAAVVRAVGVTLWIAGPIALGAAVGAAAYASTRRRSLPRTALGTAAAVGVAAALLALGSAGFAGAALAFGWAVAIPADKAGRIASRGLPLIVVAGAATTSSWGRISDLGTWQRALVFAISPLVAAAWVWLADAAWAALSAGRARREDSDSGNPPPGTVVK